MIRAMSIRFVAALLLLAPLAAGADDAPIADNSFLVEEAYNQEPGVVQHISFFSRDRAGNWVYTLTQEWPLLSQKHQLSPTIPVQDLGAGTGLGDIALNYRYQAVLHERAAFSPRLSLIVPTGSESRGYGTGHLGVQANLPLSLALSDRLVAHLNLGGTLTPGLETAEGRRSLRALTGAGSLVLHFGSRFDLLAETALARAEGIGADGRRERADSVFISPGARLAFNFASGLQIVPGAALAFGVGPSASERMLLLYLSFEHPF